MEDNKDDSEYIKMSILVDEITLPNQLKQLFYKKSFHIASKKRNFIFSGVIVTLQHPIRKWNQIKIPNSDYYSSKVI